MPSYARDALKASFMRLISERPLSQITVKDIVQDCGVNRNTFYYHFDDIPAMITEIITERADAVMRQHSAITSAEACFNAIFCDAMANKRAILHMYRSASRDTVENYLMRICRHMVEAYGHTVFADAHIAPEDREVLLRFFQCECFGQAVLWLNSGLAYDWQTALARQAQLVDGMLQEMVRRCEERQAQAHSDNAQENTAPSLS